MRWIAIFITTMFLFSCQSSENKKRIEEIEIQSQRLKSVADIYLAIDSIKIKNSFNTVKYNLARIDSLSLKRSNKLMKDYGNLKKEFKNYLKSRPFIIDELSFTNNQLSDLRHDVKYNKLSDKEFELYMKHESNAAQRLRVKMSYYDERLKNKLMAFDSLNPKIISFIDSCKLAGS